MFLNLFSYFLTLLFFVATSECVFTHFYLHLPKTNTNWGKQKPTYQASNDINNLDNTIKNTDSLPKFKTFLKKLTVKNCIERN